MVVCMLSTDAFTCGFAPRSWPVPEARQEPLGCLHLPRQLGRKHRAGKVAEADAYLSPNQFPNTDKQAPEPLLRGQRGTAEGLSTKLDDDNLWERGGQEVGPASTSSPRGTPCLWAQLRESEGLLIHPERQAILGRIPFSRLLLFISLSVSAERSFPDQLTIGRGCHARWAQGLACCQEPADPGAPDHPLSSMQVCLGHASQVPSICGHGV